MFKQLNFLPSKVIPDVVSDRGNLGFRLVVALKPAKLHLLADNCRANKICWASIVTGVFLLQICGWHVERAFFCFHEEVRGEQNDLFPELLSPCMESHLGLIYSSGKINMRRPEVGMKINLGTIFIWFLVFNVSMPGCFRQDSRLWDW